jgi:hypothetical protein
MKSLSQSILAASLAVSLMSGSAVAQVTGSNLDDLAKELANPGGSSATMNFKFEYRSFDGNLPGAGKQENFTTTFQPVLPFRLDNGNNLIVRPAFAYVLDQPSFDASTGQFNRLDGFGDIAYDVLYSTQNGDWTLGAGVVGAIPVGSEVSGKNWLLGPSVLAVKTMDWGVAGLFPFHNQKVGGTGADVSITSLQYFLFYGLGDGWQIGTGPTISYDWNAGSGNQWTVPIGVSLAKTTTIGGEPVKLNATVEYGAIRPDDFGQEWKLSFTFSPVTKNPFVKN